VARRKSFAGEAKQRVAEARREKIAESQFQGDDPEGEMIAENQERAEEERDPPVEQIKRSRMRFLKPEQRDEVELRAELGEIEIIEDQEEGPVEPPTPSLEEFRTAELKSLISKLTLARSQAKRVEFAASASINTLEYLLQEGVSEEDSDQAVPPLQFLSFTALSLDEDSTILKELAATISVLTRTICEWLKSSQEDGEED
jgi:hypothetical protein